MIWTVPGDRLEAVPGGAAMTTTTTTSELVPGYLDVTSLAVASFLASYCEPTPTAYKQLKEPSRHHVRCWTPTGNTQGRISWSCLSRVLVAIDRRVEVSEAVVSPEDQIDAVQRTVHGCHSGAVADERPEPIGSAIFGTAGDGCN